jgi:heme A synthase
VVVGFASAVAMWVVWLATHLPEILSRGGGTAPAPVVGPLVLGALFVSILLGARHLGRHLGREVGRELGRPALDRLAVPRLGLVAGLVAGVVTLLLLGSKVVEQPASTAEMSTKANDLRPDAPVVVLGFLAACAVFGLVAALLGARTARARAPHSAAHWLGVFATVTAVAIVPLLILGGAVTSTESGMAVPDAVTSYGALSFLFPISLMAEPRIFLEHSHRLFGTLVGVTAIALAVATIAQHRARWLPRTLAALAFVVLVAGALGAHHAGKVPALPALLTVGLVGVGCLGFTFAALSRDRMNAAAVGVLALISIQGIYGIIRVDENLAWMAMFHGVFAQLVFAAAVALAARLSGLFRAPGVIDEPTRTAAAGSTGLTHVLLGMLLLQLVFGAMSRHLNSMHAVISHVVLGMVLFGTVLAAGFSLRRASADHRTGRVLRTLGMLLLVVVSVQFLLGFAALVLVLPGTEQPTIPLAGELSTAHGFRLTEALTTTAHQSGGAVLLAIATLAMVWAGRLKRADSPATPPPADLRPA